MTPRNLTAGDRIALVAPARSVTYEEIAPAIDLFRSWGLVPVLPEGIFDTEGQLAGSDEHRAMLLQQCLDDESISAIACCRGGYGTVRIIDRLDFSRYAQSPKWIIGYSDITVLHSHIHVALGHATLHATMPINITGSPTPATESLRRTLFGEKQEITWSATGRAAMEPIEAPVVGGNLSILYSLLGSRSQIDTHGKILLIEDLDEYLYHLDRMMQALHRAGMLDDLAALLVGGMTEMHDNSTPFGRTAFQIISEAMQGGSCPVIFGAPFGHLGDNNIAIPLGVEMHLDATNLEKVRIFAA